MTTLVQGRELTKSYRRHRGILQASFDLAGGERVPGSQRRRQDVAVRFTTAASPDWFNALPNVQDATTEDDELQVHLRALGDPDGVIAAAAKHTAVNIMAREPSLEEVSCASVPKTGAPGRGDGRPKSATTPMRCDRAL